MKKMSLVFLLQILSVTTFATSDYSTGYAIGSKIAGLDRASLGLDVGIPFRYITKPVFCSDYLFIKYADKSKFPQSASDEFIDGYNHGGFVARVAGARNFQNDIVRLQSDINLLELYNKNCLVVK